MGFGDLVTASMADAYGITDVSSGVQTLSNIIDVIITINPAIGASIIPFKALDVALGKPSTEGIEILAKAPYQSADETLGQLKELANTKGQETYTKYLEMLDVLQGNTARMQLEAILGKDIPKEAVVTSRIFDQVSLVTNLNAGIALISIIGEILSIGQIDRVGDELRSYLDYSGLSQITGYGYGQILSTVLGPPMQQELLADMRTTQPAIGDIIAMRTRGIIDKKEYLARAAKLGFADNIAENLYTTSLFYPQVQDWIRFSVRDVFNPAVVESAGLDLNFPENVVEPASKAGVDRTTLEWYWRAHWQLPSPNQAYEMYHRGYLTRDQLHDLLVTADYAPGYIDAYMGIAETPYTRVDARRMLSAGVLSNDEYIRAMMDIGYSHDKAEKLLQWALNEDGTKDKDLSISQYMRGYDLGLVTESELRKYVKKQGYDDVETDTLVKMHITDYNDKKVAHSIKYYDKIYIRGDIEDAEYIAGLSALNIPMARAYEMLNVAKESKVMAQKLPTKAEILKWFKAGNMSEPEARAWLSRLGYDDYIVNMYINYTPVSSDKQEDES